MNTISSSDSERANKCKCLDLQPPTMKAALPMRLVCSKVLVAQSVGMVQDLSSLVWNSSMPTPSCRSGWYPDVRVAEFIPKPLYTLVLGAADHCNREQAPLGMSLFPAMLVVQQAMVDQVPYARVSAPTVMSQGQAGRLMLHQVIEICADLPHPLPWLPPVTLSFSSEWVGQWDPVSVLRQSQFLTPSHHTLRMETV